MKQEKTKNQRAVHLVAFASIFLVTLLTNHWILTFTIKLIISSSLFYIFCKIYERLRTKRYISTSGRCVFITGCDTGFGNKVARKLDKLGITVFAGCLFSEKEDALKLKRECSSSLHIVQLDVTVDQNIKDALSYVTENLNGKQLHAIVNNAGIGSLAPAEWADVHVYRKVLEVNTLGVQNVSHHFLPLLRESKGRIINVISIAARLYAPFLGPYSMSKAATKAYNDTIRKELEPFGIKVIRIEPKAYRTPINDSNVAFKYFDNLYNDPERPHIREVYGERYRDSIKKRVYKNQVQNASANIDEDVDAVVNAVLDAEPKHQYEPNAFDWIVKLIIQFMPDTTFDYIVRLKADVQPAYCELK